MEATATPGSWTCRTGFGKRRGGQFSEEDFRTRLKERRVELRIRGEKYSFSMKDERGKQRIVREGRLGRPIREAHLQEKFRQQREQLLRDPEAYRLRLKEERTHRYSWERDLRGQDHRGAQDI